jgi:hypothetical protein
MVPQEPRLTHARRAIFIAPLVCLSAASAQEQLFIARDIANQLRLDLSEPPIFDVPPSGDPALPGWVTDDPSLVTLPMSIPEQGLFTLDPGADLWLQLVSADPHLHILNPVSFQPLQPGSQFHLGSPVFDAVLLWNISLPTDEPLQATVRLFDAGPTGYLASPDYTIGFTTVPGPGWVSTAPVLISLASCRRRRTPRSK